MLLSLVILCFTLSGFAALLYQTAWMRLFSIAFGTSEIAVAIVLAGYMAGLAIGAAIAARYVNRIARPILVYGALEGAIALAALLLPVLVALTGSLYAVMVGGQPQPPNASAFGQPLFYSIAAFAVLLIPTALMGATLPLLARYVVTSNRNLGARISALYSMNTLGAVGGTLVAGFWLLPAVGLKGTVWVGVAINALVFLLAVLLSRRAGDLLRPDNNRNGSAPAMARVFPILPLILLSGVLSFIYEVLWTRMLSHVLGSSVYAFATMLAAFLTGIALGAAGASLGAKDRRHAAWFFALCQFGISITSAFIYWRLQQAQSSGSSDALLAFAVILPSTLFIGATYPLAVRVLAGSADDAGRASAIVYSWNTVGAIIGAIAGGFFIIPMLGFEGTVQVAVTANLLIGIAAVVLAMRVAGARRLGKLLAAASVIASIAVIALFQPTRPDALVTQSIFGGSGGKRVKEHYYAVGRSSTVYLVENEARFDLSTNGLPEAQIEFRGAPPYVLSQRWLGMWPSLAHPEAKSMLVVGLGGGVVLEGIPASIASVDIVELEVEVLRANEIISDRRNIDRLNDPRMHVVINDARNALRLTSRRYDAIVSQPSHPWTAGASHLFTREFFALVKSHLNDDGVFVQWMNAEFLDETLLRRLAATLLAEFDYVRIYQPTSLALHFVASNQPFEIEANLATTGRPVLDEPAHYARNGIGGPADVIATLLVDQDGTRALAGSAVPMTDDDNRMAFDSNVRAQGIGVDRLTRATAAYDPLLLVDSWLRQALSDRDLAYITWRLTRDGQTPRVERLIASIESASTRKLLQAILMHHRGRYAEAKTLLSTILPGEPLYEVAVFLRVQDQLPWLAAGTQTIADLPVLDLQRSRLGAVLTGWSALSERNWQQILSLEQRLGQTRMSDLWAPYAAALRAEWRLQADDPDGRLAREALDFIDGALATHATLNGYTQRARAASKLQDGAMFVESVAFVVHTIRQRILELEFAGETLDAGEHRATVSRLEVLAEELQSLAAADRSGRAMFVLYDLRALRAEF